MGVPGQSTVSQTARLMLGGPSYVVGWQEPVYVANPAAGAVWSHTVAGRYYERLLSVHSVFVTSAVVATRFPQLQLLDSNGTVVTAVAAGGGIAAGTTLTADLMLGGPVFDGGTSGGSFGFLSDILVPPGWSWKMLVTNIDAGDQFSNVVLLVQRFPSDTFIASVTD